MKRKGATIASAAKKSKSRPVRPDGEKRSSVSKSGVYKCDVTPLNSDEEVRRRDGYKKPLPKRNSDGVIIFPDAVEFRPNLTPKEVLHAGSFGGTYFRPIQSSVTGLKYEDMWQELPQNWLRGLDVSKMISSSSYDKNVNMYKVKCGGSLEMWESSGWIVGTDPYGWFMWYCRFYLGRRTEDDDRQISRWKNCAGPKGRWKGNLIGKIARALAAFDDPTISPVVRQVLLHWGYKLTEKDFLDSIKE